MRSDFARGASEARRQRRARGPRRGSCPSRMRSASSTSSCVVATWWPRFARRSGESLPPDTGSLPRPVEAGGKSYAPGGARLGSDHLHEPATVALAVELDEEHALPRAEAELAVADGDGLAGRSEQHGHAVRVPVPDLHVLGADVLGAAV